MAQVRLEEVTDLKMLEIIKQRKKDNNPVRSKQGIVQEYINAGFKKEVGK